MKLFQFLVFSVNAALFLSFVLFETQLKPASAQTPPPAPATSPITTTATTLRVKVFYRGSFNNATKQGDWVKGTTVQVVKNPSSATTPAYNTTKTTDTQGAAVFYGVVPNGVYNVTVSKGNCATATQTYVISNDLKPNSHREIKCEDAPSYAQPIQPATPGQPLIVINQFKLQGGASEAKANTDITLDYEYTGLAPTHYKAEECSAFNAPYIKWRSLPSSGMPTIKIPTPRTSTICFQLKQVGSGGAEVISTKSQDSINVVPNIETADYVTGSGSTFQYAKDQGFQFSASNIKQGSNCYLDPPRGDLLCFDETVEDASCRFRLFDGKKLRPGWRFKSVTLDWPNNGYQIVQGIDSDGPVIIEFAYPDSEYNEIKRDSIRRQVKYRCAGGGWSVGVGVTLTGPKGFTWRDAFTPY